MRASPGRPPTPPASRLTWHERALLWPAALLGAGMVRVLAGSCRVVRVAGAEHLSALEAEPRPVIPCAWHRQLVFLSWWLQREVATPEHPLAFMASWSRDGELAARVLRLQGGRVVRGSASRGGLEGMRALQRMVRREGASPVLLPDGPRGPVGEFKTGGLVLSQVTGAPLLPVACAVEPAWRLRSWDRMLVPRPFARVAVAIDAPRAVPRDLATAGLEELRRELETRLDALGDEAAEALA